MESLAGIGLGWAINYHGDDNDNDGEDGDDDGDVGDDDDGEVGDDDDGEDGDDDDGEDDGNSLAGIVLGWATEMQKAASMASALVLFFHPAVLIFGQCTRKTC